MCSGGSEKRRRQQQAQQRQAQIDAANASAAAAQAQTAAEMQQLQNDYNSSVSTHRNKMGEVRAENDARLKGIASTGLAVSNSLRILGGAGPATAPSAQKTKRDKYPGTTQAKVRANTTPRSGAAGTNLSI